MHSCQFVYIMHAIELSRSSTSSTAFPIYQLACVSHIYLYFRDYAGLELHSHCTVRCYYYNWFVIVNIVIITTGLFFEVLLVLFNRISSKGLALRKASPKRVSQNPTWTIAGTAPTGVVDMRGHTVLPITEIIGTDVQIREGIITTVTVIHVTIMRTTEMIRTTSPSTEPCIV